MSKSDAIEYYNDYRTEHPGCTPHPSLTPLKRQLFTRLIDEHTDDLDFGCGGGAHYGQVLASITRSCHGLDASEVSVEVAREQ